MHKRQLSETNAVIMSNGTQMSMSYMSQMIFDDQMQQSYEPPTLSLLNCTEHNRTSVVTLSAAKGLACWTERCFAALSMTGRVAGEKFHQDRGRPIPGRRLIP
jgi:hypothetical protein